MQEVKFQATFCWRKNYTLCYGIPKLVSIKKYFRHFLENNHEFLLIIAIWVLHLAIYVEIFKREAEVEWARIMKIELYIEKWALRMLQRGRL